MSATTKPAERHAKVVSRFFSMSASRARSAPVDGSQPKSMTRGKVWTEEVEEAYRFQLAGYRDEREYVSIQSEGDVDRWPHNGFVKKLKRRDGCFYYYNKARECPDKEVHKTKIYAY